MVWLAVKHDVVIIPYGGELRPCTPCYGRRRQRLATSIVCLSSMVRAVGTGWACSVTMLSGKMLGFVTVCGREGGVCSLMRPH